MVERIGRRGRDWTAADVGMRHYSAYRSAWVDVVAVSDDGQGHIVVTERDADGRLRRHGTRLSRGDVLSRCGASK